MSDPAFTCHFLDREQFRAAEAARMELVRRRHDDPAWMAANHATYGWASLGEVVAPCAMWHVPWFYDPEDRGDRPARDKALAAIADGSFGTEGKNYYLSRFYWKAWSLVRPPICVLTPNGREWCVDAISSNGHGWEVTGAAPLITCSPSIDVPGYHGFLGINGAPPGIFTPDIGGRGAGTR